MPKDTEVNCPTCAEIVPWVPTSTYRPFCSKRCQDADFIDWANEEKRIAGAGDYDDIFSEPSEDQ
ncbi:DNA gyrase inhibitor YacG [Pseudomonadales bacterium]|jgi:endogenous inhibitor of DNA gyrase (YacG/DUF329 family)|nr:DNA gyrase inhibitor YacG [Pseudomonadales bacterium]